MVAPLSADVPGRELLEVDRLRVRYKSLGRPGSTAVDEVSFAVSPGEVVGLVGESGCGKSTIAKAICGLVRTSGGEIRFKGTQVGPLTSRRRPASASRIQMVFQDPFASLNPRRTVGDQIRDGLMLSHRLDASTPAGGDSVVHWLQRVGLDGEAASRLPHQFSGGQRQRIAIARALAARPELLIGDEPIASLDASLQAQTAELMRSLAVESATGLLFISHDLAVVRLIADRILVMREGRIVESGPTEAVWNSPQHPYTQLLLDSIPVPDGLGRLTRAGAEHHDSHA